MKKLIVFLGAITAVTACSWTESHSHGGQVWQQACAAHPQAECPCHRDKDCETLWCVNGECARREP